MVRLVKEEGVAQARLAELLEIEPISVSRLLDRMEEGGWVERRQDASDRRVRMIFPTEKSRKTFGEVKSVAVEVFDQAMAGLSPEERRATIHGLATIVENLGAAETAAAREVEASKGSAA
jgi:MarR family transcriptional regulator, transcriptional regulator for hemolysin